MIRIPERLKRFFVYDENGFKLILEDKVIDIADYYAEPYHNQWYLSMRSFELSGVEAETQDEYSTSILATILIHYGISHKIKRDATAHAEFTMSFNDFIKILGVARKLGVKFVSTHIHCSSPLIYFLVHEYATNYSYKYSYIKPNEAQKIFGRKFNRYADDYLSYWKQHRNGCITYPKLSKTSDKIFIDLSSHSDRVTVEFRVLKLHSKTVLKRFLLFILMWYVFETRLPKQYLRQPLMKAVEVVTKINTKTLCKISLDKLIQKIKQFEEEVLARYTFYFHVQGRAPFKPDFSR